MNAHKGREVEKMFAISITAKLLVLYLALKIGDEGRPSRPWILGTTIAVVFSLFDLGSMPNTLRGNVILCLGYLALSLGWMHWYYRIQNVALALLVGAVGAVLLLFGVPVFVQFILNH